MAQTIERCINCDEPTGRAGLADDSLFCDDCGGPFCWECWNEKHDPDDDDSHRPSEINVDEYIRSIRRPDKIITNPIKYY